MTNAIQEKKDALNVLMVSTSFPKDISDWRGLFIRHMADALGRRSDIHLHLWAPPGDVHEDVVVALPATEREWLTRLMDAGGIAHLYRCAGLIGIKEIGRLMLYLRRLYRRSDEQMLHVNWLQNALPLPDDGRPLLVTVLGTDLQLLKLPLMKTLLRRTFKSRAAIVCPNADWMVAPLKSAFGDVASIEFVPFGIDPSWFRIERKLQLSPPKWIAVTRLTRAKLGPLFEICEPSFRNAGRELHLIGPMQETISIPDWVKYHGPLGPEILRIEWFPAASGLITLSQHAEGRPQVMLEAMAAGLPIVASDISAHSSFLSHCETGYLLGSNQSLDTLLAQIESPEINGRIGAAARDWAMKNVGTWGDCAERYVSRYRRLLSNLSSD